MKEYLIYFLIAFVRYFSIAGLAYIVFYKLFNKQFVNNKIQSRIMKKKDVIREILYSTQSTIIITLIGLLMLKTPLVKFTNLYTNVNDFSIWWIPLSIIIALILHDTYFYWMHRLMHKPKLYKKIHLIHHKSINPSPWASYSFHLFESIIEALIAPIIFILLPLHPIAIFTFVFLGFTINVYGHLGYEITPKWFRHSFLFEILNTSTHHNIHHSKFKGNYGLNFRIWDRLMKTEHPDYVKEYDKIQEKRFGTYKPISMRWKYISLSVLTAILCFLMLSFKSDNSIEGKWKDEENKVVILIYKNKGEFFGELISAENPKDDKAIKNKEKDVVIMKNFVKKTNKNYCCGTIYLPKKKVTVKATLTLLDSKTLQIDGKFGIFKGTHFWEKL